MAEETKPVICAKAIGEKAQKAADLREAKDATKAKMRGALSTDALAAQAGKLKAAPKK